MDKEKRSETLFGRIAVMSGFCSLEEMEHCAREHEDQLSSGDKADLGEIMLRRGILDLDQVNEVLRTQHFTEMQDKDRNIGRRAVCSGLIDEDDVRDCLARQDRLFGDGKPVPTITDMLVKQGKITENDVESIQAAG